MGLINPAYSDRVRYTLDFPEIDSIKTTEPIGWETDEKEYARNEKYHGIVSKFSNNLTFIDDAADFITLVRSIYGINAEIRLKREEKHPHTDDWRVSYSGFLDMSTYEREEGQVAIKFNSGGLESILKARESEKVEIEREEDLDGNDLPALNTKLMTLDGRRIFLESDGETDTLNNKSINTISSNAGGTREEACSVPIKVINNSHQNILKTTTPLITSNWSSGDLGQMLLYDMDRERKFSIKISDLEFSMTTTRYTYIDWAVYAIDICIFENGINFDFKENIRLLKADDDASGDEYQLPIYRTAFTLNDQRDITLLEGESLALLVRIKADFRNPLTSRARFYTETTFRGGTLTIQEDSVFNPTKAKFVLAHEYAERMKQILTPKYEFYSEALGRTDIGYQKNGPAAYTGLLHGFWIRGFDKYPQTEDNRYKSPSISFKDFAQSMETIRDIGVGIETRGFSERLVMEDLKYFYPEYVTVKLPNQIKKVKRTSANEYYYSSINLGYEKGGSYEEALGLDEANVRSNFSTCITGVVNTFASLSKIRTDPYGIEFPRRKPKSDNPTEDTSYDEDIYALDLKIENYNFETRKWQDDFVQAPEGIFSPETAFNLRFSPMNLLLQKGWFLASSFIDYPDKYVRNAATEGNNKLITQQPGRPAYSEQGKVLNSDLGRPRFEPEWIEFEHLADFDVLQQVEGFTNIEGREIPNFYGKIEFLNEDNEWERGYLFSLKPNGEGKWKILKSYN